MPMQALSTVGQETRPLRHLREAQSMMLTKFKADRHPKWCACCGRPIREGDEYVRIDPEDGGGSRCVAASHLVSWAAHSGDQETLPLNTYMRPES